MKIAPVVGCAPSKHAAPDGALADFIALIAIDMALLAELSRPFLALLIPAKTARNHVLSMSQVFPKTKYEWVA